CESPGEAFGMFLRRLVAAAFAIFIDRSDMRRLDEKRSELFALPGTAADCQGAERNAVIALAPRNEVPALRLAAFNKILPRELERGLDGLRTAAHKKHVGKG